MAFVSISFFCLFCSSTILRCCSKSFSEIPWNNDRGSASLSSSLVPIFPIEFVPFVSSDDTDRCVDNGRKCTASCNDIIVSFDSREISWLLLMLSVLLLVGGIPAATANFAVWFVVRPLWIRLSGNFFTRSRDAAAALTDAFWIPAENINEQFFLTKLFCHAKSKIQKLFTRFWMYFMDFVLTEPIKSIGHFSIWSCLCYTSFDRELKSVMCHLCRSMGHKQLKFKNKSIICCCSLSHACLI